jgi:hypothetical protein
MGRSTALVALSWPFTCLCMARGGLELPPDEPLHDFLEGFKWLLLSFYMALGGLELAPNLPLQSYWGH